MPKTIVYRDEPIDSAIARFKKDVGRSGILRDLKKHETFISNTEKRIIAKKDRETKRKKYLKNKNNKY